MDSLFFSIRFGFSFGGLLEEDRLATEVLLEGVGFFFTGVITFATGVFLELRWVDLSFIAMVESTFNCVLNELSQKMSQ